MNELTREQKLAAARSRMAELAAKFLERTAADVAAMRDALARPGDVADIAQIRHLAHRMVGTGATLGFDSLSECAQRIEQLAEGCAPGSMPDPGTREQLGHALDRLGNELLSLRDPAAAQ
jgi:HPt (histidine-containing phosphotransfer) domain-containing protein